MHRYNHILAIVMTLLLGSLFFSPGWSQGNIQERIHYSGKLSLSAAPLTDGRFLTPADAWQHKVDAAGRMLFEQYQAAKPERTNSSHLLLPGIRAAASDAGEPAVNVFVRLRPAMKSSFLALPEVRLLAEAGDIAAVRLPVSFLRTAAQNPAVERIELSRESQPALNASRVEMGAGKVHQGTGLPQAYRGKGVIVGVIDSGIDFTHPDFSDENGTRIQYLLEYTQDGNKSEWTKAQIDADPGAVTERDGDGSWGHGTHVTGTAAGGGHFNADYTGIAPESDIIFVKGIRNPDSRGGFEDADVLAGCQYIFQKAQQTGKPAVINLSLGGHFGPHDGSSLYEQGLSELTGPGHIIVASAGNEGDNPVHAGTAVIPDTNYATFLYSTSPVFGAATMWYDAGILDRVMVSAFIVQNSQLFFAASSGWVPIGMSATGIEMEYQNTTLGYVNIDAKTTQDPNNGDGNVFFMVHNNNQETIDVSQTLWLLVAKTKGSGRLDNWAVSAGFLSYAVGFKDAFELPGNTDYTVGIPGTALKTICVGSYVTKNNWVDIDGVSRDWTNPDPQNPDNRIIPELGQHSYFSSLGPTRDNRTAPDICAPGEFIFAPLSSHLTEGIGYTRDKVLQGGGYQGMQGTSMASPHVTGLTALMLQANPSLDYQQVVQILRETARSDEFTGALPDNRFGWGKVDALEAVKAAAGSGNAIASVDVTQLAIQVKPDETGSAHFKLSNPGQAVLNFTLTAATPGLLSKPAAILRGPETHVLQPLPAETAGQTRQQSPLRQPVSIPALQNSPAPAPAPAGDDLLINDDGNALPDNFLGWGNGNNFDWINEFHCEGFDFNLENIHFYMQTGSALTNMVYIFIYDGSRQLITSGYVSLDLAAQGNWFNVALNEPVAFSDGDTFFIHLQTFYSMIDYPAGFDFNALLTGRSYYINGSGEWVNLNTTADFPNAAFLLRAEGTKNIVTPNQPPVAAAQLSKTEAETGETITFDASGSYDTDGQIAQYLWDFGDGNSSNQQIAVHAYAQAGSFDWTLTVTDDRGATDQTGGQVTITQQPGNQPPVAVASVSPTAAQTGDTVFFDASQSYDTDGSITQYAWNFGDGSGSSQASVSHVYTTAGEFTYTLIVTDDKGATNQASGPISIQPRPCRLSCTPAAGTVAPGSSQDIRVNFDATALAEGNYSGEIQIGGNGGDITLPVQILVDMNVSIASAAPIHPDRFGLSQNYPNPFNPETMIRYQLASPSGVTLSIFDVTGRRVRSLVSGMKTAGSYQIRWDGKDDSGRRVSSGIYICRLDVLGRESRDSYTFAKKMILLK